MIWTFLLVLVPSLASFWATERFRRYAVRNSMIDVPNERSSHSVPTPRGGGVAIAGSVIATLALLAIWLPGQRSTAFGILGGGMLVALIGLLDDRFGLSARLRLLIHFGAAAWVLLCTSGSAELRVWGTDISLLAHLFAAVFIVWCINLYNFMDGLDGFAGGQALVAATAAALIFHSAGDHLLANLMFATAGAAAGFLVWNWPPAKIFMGDCGSGFLGFLFGAIVIAGYRHGSMPLAAGIMLILVFLGDATLTLLRRMFQGEAWHQPHRSHAYQLATQLGATHRQVTIVSIAFFALAGSLAFFISRRSEMGAVLLGGYAIVIVGIWMLINRLMVGRRQALAGIADRQAVLRRETEAAAAIYLRFRRLHSRLRTWRSEMPKKDLLTEATGVASELGYTVSHDWLEGCGGGRCEVGGEKWILLDFNMTKQDQIRQILLAIEDELEGAPQMSTDLRSALDRAKAPQTEARRKAA